MNSSRPSARFAGMYLLIIAINVLVFLLQVVQGVGPLSPATGDMINWGANVAALTLTGDAWRLLTSMFLHIGLIHIAFNMYMLLAFGPIVERQFGHGRFTLIYLLSGLFGSLVSAMYHADGGKIVVAAGASGALMGISGAFIGHWLVAGARHAAQEQISMRGPLVQTIVINLVLGFINPGVDNACHVGGLVSGVLLGAALALGDFRHSRAKRAGAATLIALVSLGSIYMLVHRPATPTMVQMGEALRAELQAENK